MKKVKIIIMPFAINAARLDNEILEWSKKGASYTVTHISKGIFITSSKS
jgi:hypothetical protein